MCLEEDIFFLNVELLSQKTSCFALQHATHILNGDKSQYKVSILLLRSHVGIREDNVWMVVYKPCFPIMVLSHAHVIYVLGTNTQLYHRDVFDGLDGPFCISLNDSSGCCRLFEGVADIHLVRSIYVQKLIRWSSEICYICNWMNQNVWAINQISFVSKCVPISLKQAIFNQ